ncbi:RNA 3'-terminal phosphate cyclase [Candidatus Nitrosotenuis uzonensis]|uniref:RNA 3'-terminal phosphate cyclase n=1 Tax=Candidatus Nitrosotenuis uzonensis TaxID=1407055 RepID=V6AVN9_9ARCH|nr:RNA 3'-terminal phosphate cyclase [Candidatus Nitrosotenuis uzonensis]CDI06658.1 RNA-3'-phosphate cyclase [Candidatus Nitrosotenuis uzonensis]
MNILEIDGSFGEGGGQILRSTLSLACITSTPIKIKNIRNNRKMPGLQAQHLTAAKILAKTCNAKTDGLHLGSTSLTFVPGQMQDVSISEDIGTAGSISLILQAVIPAVALAGKKLHLQIRGGTDVPWSPTSNYTKYVVAEAYRRIGIDFTMKIERRGYYPKGGGLVEVIASPAKTVFPICLQQRMQKEARIICSCTELTGTIEKSINTAKNMLEQNGFSVLIETAQEKAANRGGSALVFSSDPNSINGADELLDIHNEDKFTSRSAMTFINSDLGADVNLSDMLVVPLSLCNEMSIFTVKTISKHLETNLYITSKILGCKYGIGKIDGGYEVRLQGISNARIK